MQKVEDLEAFLECHIMLLAFKEFKKFSVQGIKITVLILEIFPKFCDFRLELKNSALQNMHCGQVVRAP